MDVLVRHSPTPPTLRALAMEGAAGTVAAAAMACPADSVELEGARDFLRGELTVAIREELVPVVGRQLSSSPAAFGQKTRADPDPESRMDCDNGSQVKNDDEIHYKRDDRSAFFLSVFVRTAIVRNPRMHGKYVFNQNLFRNRIHYHR